MARKIGASLLSFLVGGMIGVLGLLAIKPGLAGRKQENFYVQGAVSARQPHLRAELVSRLNNYLRDRSRHQMVLLREIISVYSRTDAAEFLEVLNAIGARALVSIDGDEIFSAMNVDDLRQVLKTASTLDPRIADELIATAFRRTIASDPKEAFDRLKELPAYMRESLANELAASWGRKNGPEAANAFFEFGGVLQWRNQFGSAMASWGKTDPAAAFNHIQGLVTSTPLRDNLLTDYLVGLTKLDANAAVQLICAQSDVPLSVRARFEFIIGTFADAQPEAAISAIREARSADAKVDALRVIAKNFERNRPLLAIEAATNLPVSVDSLASIARAAESLATNSDDPFSIPNASTNAYQREAIQAGVAQGMFESQGSQGIAGVVRHAMSSGDAGWLDAAGSIIVKNVDSESALWRTLPNEVASAVLSFAETNWPPARVVALRAQLTK